MGQERRISRDNATSNNEVVKTMTETETALLSALERLANNRTETEEKIMETLKTLVDGLIEVYAENEKLKAELQILSEQQAEQSEALQQLSTVLETLSSTLSQLWT